MSKTKRAAPERMLRTFYAGMHAVTIECDKHANTVETFTRADSGECTSTLATFASVQEARAHYAREVNALSNK